MLQLERQQKILDYLKENRKATTNELSELLGVSTT
ncbi:MAG: DeoR family transcriptional regulator [Agathobacter rectalis]